ncbi:hypothetical protein PG997_000158 [Apiospora hydei]|uniref:Uncharacterized protein n=1 Tax=Apiospora hydei TaxID=1337664 RepID=A0ABR1X9Y5_9PEZI
MDTDGQVYLGVWTNWSRGSAIMGATLTTTQSTGNILIAFTATFIPFVASRLWKMFCFAVHTCSSKRGSQGTIYHQRQVVLRNSSSADSGAFSLLALLWTWRRLPAKSLSRLLPLLIFAILFIVGFTVAGGYSSQITSTMGDEVLLKGDNCGMLTLATSEDDYDRASACYANQAANVFDCNRFIVGSLPTETADGNAACPFASDVCRDNATNLRLDSGYIDSNDHMGLNAPQDQRIFFRMVLSCAPLSTRGYKTSHIQGNRTFVRYNYGNLIGANYNLFDYTYAVPDRETQYKQADATNNGLNFRVSPEVSRSFNNSWFPLDSTFVPNRTIETTDGDTLLVFLSGNGVKFLQESDDAWYRATNPYGSVNASYGGGSGQVFTPTEEASPLGCVQQWQWCKSGSGNARECGPLAGWMDAMAGAVHLVNSSSNALDASLRGNKSGSKIGWISGISWMSKSSIYDLLLTFGAKALESQSLLSAGVQLGVSKNQWQLDVANWWNITLAIQQAAFVSTAMGYPEVDTSLKSMIYSPKNDEERHLCQNQKIRHKGYASFSLFGLLFTYIFGALVIVMSFALDPIMRCLHTRRKYRQYQYLEWRTNGALQLHRLAQDELRYGKWSGCTEIVPITHPEDRLADLDISDLEYPRLNGGVVGEDTKPEADSHTEIAGSDQVSVETSEDTMLNTDAQNASSESLRTSEAEPTFPSLAEESRRPEAQRVSMLSEEEIDGVHAIIYEADAENTQETNRRH